MSVCAGLEGEPEVTMHPRPFVSPPQHSGPGPQQFNVAKCCLNGTQHYSAVNTF